jgi:hypothetical protein
VPNRSDRCPHAKTKSRSPDRIRLVKEIPCGASAPHRNKYEGSRRIENHPIDQTYLPLFVSYLLLSPNPSLYSLIYCSSFVSAMSEGVLGGLVDPRGTLPALAPTGSPPEPTFYDYCRNLSSIGLTSLPHRSDRCQRRGAATAAFARCWPQKVPTHLQSYLNRFPISNGSQALTVA